MYSPHYAFQKSFNFSVSYLYVFVAQPCHLLKDNRIDFSFSQHKNTLFYFDNYMTIIRPSVQNSEYVYTCVHIRTRVYVWNFVPWYAEEYRCVENRDTDLWQATAHNINYFISSHFYCTTRRNYGDRSPQLCSSQQDLKLLPTQTDVTTNFHVMTSEMVAFCTVPSYCYSSNSSDGAPFN